MSELPENVDAVIDLALAEDTNHGDITSEILIPKGLEGRASFLVKANGVLAGIGVAERVFFKVDPSLKFETLIDDGAHIKKGDIVATVFGKTTSILKGERVALNFLTRMSGIATGTAEYVNRSHGFPVQIKDTRKTTPGLRSVEKYAVRMGGGVNHRLHLSDGILIKDNHLAALRALGLSLKDIVVKAKQGAPEGITVEVEVTNTQEAQEAVAAGADIIMFDNMTPERMAATIEVLPGGIRTEASGGVRLINLRTIAATGVDIISIGALTHSVKTLDMSLELDPQTLKML